MREQVKWFAEQMEQTLQKNDHKGGWEDCDPSWLLGRLYEESNELAHALEFGVDTDTDTDRIISEATDVANFAMMIADLARKVVPTNG